MGYVHDTHMRQFIPPFMCGKTAGTWTPTIASNVVTDNRTAADAAFTVLIPIFLLSNSEDMKGAYLTSIDVWYIIATAAADDFATVELEKITLPADGDAPTGAAVTITEDTDHDSAAERKAADEHKMTVTLSTPEWIDEDEVFYLELIVDAAATTVFKLLGARANFTLRI
jgi:hypothetical protein